MDGIAEVLLALDRIEHDDELSYEQLLVLETNLFLSGLGLHDQHRDLRMDIDDMSYEELLQLEDRIGSVSTALSDEQIAKCLSRNVYKRTDQVLELNRAVVDDTKCSICQVFLAPMDALFFFCALLENCLYWPFVKLKIVDCCFIPQHLVHSSLVSSYYSPLPSLHSKLDIVQYSKMEKI
jgi:hypothetical protein